MILRDVLDVRRADDLIWVVGEDETSTTENIIAKLNGFRNQLESFVNKRVALNIKSDHSYALALLLLDGLCNEILLIHPESTKEEIVDYNAEFKPDRILTDEELYVADINIHSSNISPEGSLQYRNKTSWIIPTSGTTGKPKLIRHTLHTLTRTVKKDPTEQPVRWGLLYGLSRFAGLQVFLQSLFGGGILLIPKSKNNLEESLKFFISNACTALSATPTMWRKILMSPVSSQLQLKRITLGGEIADQVVIGALQKHFNDSRISHIYASTEAGVGFSVKDGLTGFPSEWLESGIADIEMKIVDDLLWIKVPARTNVDTIGGNIEMDNDGFLNTGDRVCVKDNRVHFLGRANGAINVGGNKVSPEEIEITLLEHPSVQLASVSGRANPFTGAIVVADVVLNDLNNESSDIEEELIEYCRSRLLAYKVPARIRIVDSLVINSTGKIRRAAQ